MVAGDSGNTSPGAERDGLLISPILEMRFWNRLRDIAAHGVQTRRAGVLRNSNNERSRSANIV